MTADIWENQQKRIKERKDGITDAPKRKTFLHKEKTRKDDVDGKPSRRKSIKPRSKGDVCPATARPSY